MEWDLDSRYSVSESKHFPSEGTLPNVAPSAPSKEEAADTPENLARRELCQVDAVPSYVLSLATSPLTNWGHFSPDGRGTPTATDQGALGGEGSLASRPVKGCCLSVAACRSCRAYPHCGGPARAARHSPKADPSVRGCTFGEVTRAPTILRGAEST